MPGCVLGWEGVEQAAPAGRWGRSWAKYGVTTSRHGFPSRLCTHTHVCTHTHTHVASGFLRWLERKSRFAGHRGAAGAQLYQDCTGAVPGMYWGCIRAGGGRGGGLGGRSREVSVPPGVLLCIAVAPEQGKLLEAGEEEQEGKRGAEGATPVFSSLAPHQEMR